MSPLLIRPAILADAPAMLAIYAPVVRETAISFELEPPSLAEFEARITKYGQRWAWLVAVDGQGALLGYAYGSPHRERAAYRWSTETSVYVHENARGQGVGKALYQDLLPVLADKGYCQAYACVALPNAGSVGLHEAVGFTVVGRFPKVGHKLGRWHDLAWLHCPLRDEPPQDAGPAPSP